jgi:hypothetical protein
MALLLADFSLNVVSDKEILYLLSFLPLVCVSIFIDYILVKTKTLYVMVAGQSVFPIYKYLIVGF